MKSLDLNTFGDSPAEITLAKILTEFDNYPTTRKIAKMLEKYARHLKILSKQTMDAPTRDWLAQVLRRDIFIGIDSWPEIKTEKGKKVITYVKNCISKKITIFRKGETK